MKSPFKHYRPTRLSDGHGGFFETLGTDTTLWGTVVVHQASVEMIVDAAEDVKIGDVIIVESL
jgi:hypothetical protein